MQPWNLMMKKLRRIMIVKNYRIIQLLPGLRMRYPKGHSTYGRVKVIIIQLFLGKYTLLEHA